MRLVPPAGQRVERSRQRTSKGASKSSNGTDPIFTANDGSNCEAARPESLDDKRAAYSLLLSRGLIRVGLNVPEGAEFVIEQRRRPEPVCARHDRYLVVSATTALDEPAISQRRHVGWPRVVIDHDDRAGFAASGELGDARPCAGRLRSDRRTGAAIVAFEMGLSPLKPGTTMPAISNRRGRTADRNRWRNSRSSSASTIPLG